MAESHISIERESRAKNMLRQTDKTQADNKKAIC